MKGFSLTLHMQTVCPYKVLSSVIGDYIFYLLIMGENRLMTSDSLNAADPEAPCALPAIHNIIERL